MNNTRSGEIFFYKRPFSVLCFGLIRFVPANIFCFNFFAYICMSQIMYITTARCHAYNLKQTWMKSNSNQINPIATSNSILNLQVDAIKSEMIAFTHKVHTGILFCLYKLIIKSINWWQYKIIIQTMCVLCHLRLLWLPRPD